MKFKFLPAVACLVLFISSCEKKDALKPQQKSLGASDASNYFNQDTANSGVDTRTGYEELVKYMVTVNGTPTWDGHTYEATWYNCHLFIQIETYALNAKLGDPVYAQLTADPTAGVEVGPNSNYVQGGGVSTFKMTMIKFITSYLYSDTALIAFDKALSDFFGGITAEPPFPPGASMDGVAIKTVYGKVIKINSGSGFALAQIAWMPPPPVPLPYTVNQTSPTLNATVTASGGYRTITVVDNKTLSNLTPTFTFTIVNATHALNKTGNTYDVNSTYTSTTYPGITWTQGADWYPTIDGNITPANCIQFGLQGQFPNNPNVSNAALPIYITYNYVTKKATISYNNSAYAAYLKSLE